MTEDTRIREILEEILDSGAAPEEVCADCPDLLPQVRARLIRLQSLEEQVDEMFPSSHPGMAGADRLRARSPEARLPRIDGYDVESILGHGGMGVVYRARHLKLKRVVALKMLLSGAYASPLELSRFLREAEAVAGLAHPHIVQVHDVGELEGRPYFTMELIAGGSLAEKLAGAPLPARQAAEMAVVLADAVQWAHKHGIIHRDLKPANILTAEGTPKIADFGLARYVDAAPELTLSGARMGTPSYMAPEQALGKPGQIGPSVDIYALGAITYECLTGRPPFRAETASETERQVVEEEAAPPSSLNANVPRDLDTICLKCLHKDPSRRYATAAELADDLRRYLAGEPIRARPVSVLERIRKWARRHPALALAMSGATTSGWPSWESANSVSSAAHWRVCTPQPLPATRVWPTIYRSAGVTAPPARLQSPDAAAVRMARLRARPSVNTGADRHATGSAPTWPPGAVGWPTTARPTAQRCNSS
jgi:serine/threonine-protein kinase